MQRIGEWGKDAAGLPCFRYTGMLPYRCALKGGEAVKLPEDPWFILGNYRLTFFAHVSGEYELITGQRAWGRMNQGKTHNSGANRAELRAAGKGRAERVYRLAGMDSEAADSSRCERVFGCGFAQYAYALEGLRVVRNLSAKPSGDPQDGSSAVLLTVSVINTGTETASVRYTEAVAANYEEIRTQRVPKEKRRIRFRTAGFEYAQEAATGAAFEAEALDPLLYGSREAMAKEDAFPPALYIQADTRRHFREGELQAEWEFTLEPGKSRSFRMVIGYAFGGEEEIRETSRKLDAGRTPLPGECRSAFAEEWAKVLPEFAEEQEENLRRELRWHAYFLEAMANYSSFYRETKIPQGTIYDYDWGMHASARDNFQHALPLVYYNPALARSSLRYMMKRTTAYGEIRLIELGNGYATPDSYSTSDQQLFFFILLSEYLRVTGDYAFLAESVAPYPVTGQAEMPVLEFVEKCFLFLRDEIGTGAHGLVRLLNSDWNDAVYFVLKTPYNRVFNTGESHMNTAMAVFALQNLIPQLEKAKGTAGISEKRLAALGEAMGSCRRELLEAYLRDWGERSFPRRMYFDGKAYGEENMFLEPQGYTLLFEELPVQRKRLLYEEMKNRLYQGEKIGAREQQTPEFEDEEFDRGSRENGGVWWALNGPVILGVSTFDQQEAERLLKKMTLQHCSEEFPEYWSSWWSSADNLESSLVPGEGLPDQSMGYGMMPICCAHPHAWILYCYYYLKRNGGMVP